MQPDPTLPRESDPVLAALTEKRGYPLDNGAFMKFRDGYYVRWPDIEAAIRSRPVQEGWTDQRIAEVFGGRFEDGMWQGAEWSIQGIVEEMGPALRAARPVEVDPERLARAVRAYRAQHKADCDCWGCTLAGSSPEPRKP